MLRKFSSALGVVIYLGAVASGCATSSEVKEARKEALAAAAEADRKAEDALATAQEAKRTAEEADQRARRSEEVLNRGFKRSMYK